MPETTDTTPAPKGLRQNPGRLEPRWLKFTQHPRAANVLFWLLFFTATAALIYSHASVDRQLAAALALYAAGAFIAAGYVSGYGDGRRVALWDQRRRK